MGTLDRVGIMHKTGTKVCWVILSLEGICSLGQLYTATLDNTSNNNTACEAIENVHVRRGLEWNRHEQQLPFDFHFIIIWFDLHNSVVGALRTSSTLITSTLWATSRRSQPLKIRRQYGNTIPVWLATVFWVGPLM